MLPEIADLILLLGFWGITLIIFAENGFFLGFFLPGDSLLIAAGLLAAQGLLPIELLLVVMPIAAILGVFLGYFFGRMFGPKLFKYKKSLLFNPKHVTKAHNFYKKHGNKTLIFARFLPIIRTFAPIAAGIAKMDFKNFVIFNIIGGLIWTWSMVLIGYFLGNVIPNVETYILPLILVVVCISFIPPILERYRSKKVAAKHR